jgi:hypothetical protein
VLGLGPGVGGGGGGVVTVGLGATVTGGVWTGVVGAACDAGGPVGLLASGTGTMGARGAGRYRYRGGVLTVMVAVGAGVNSWPSGAVLTGAGPMANDVTP